MNISNKGLNTMRKPNKLQLERSYINLNEVMNKLTITESDAKKPGEEDASVVPDKKDFNAQEFKSFNVPIVSVQPPSSTDEVGPSPRKKKRNN